MNAIELAQLILPLDRGDIVRDPVTGLYIIPTEPPTEVTLRELDAAEQVLLLRDKVQGRP